MEALKDLKVPVRDVDVRRQRRDPDVYGVMRGFLTPASADNPADVALRFLDANKLGQRPAAAPRSAKLLAAGAAPGRLAVDSEVRSPVGYHVRFQQMESGVPVVGAGSSVHMNEKRQVYFMTNDLANDIGARNVVAEKAAGIPRLEAIRRAIAAVGGRGRLRLPTEARLAIYRRDERQYLAWQVHVALRATPPVRTPEDGASSWRVMIDVKSGDVIDTVNVLTRATGVGKVFCPNPVVTLRDTHLQATVRLPEYAYRHVTLEHLKGSGYLNGAHVTTRLTPAPRAFNTRREFLLDSDSPGFEEVMVYYWIDRCCTYLEQLGFKGVFKKAIPVNARGTADDQSWYDPQSHSLEFGLGGVNDAEDADIVMHEFGHAYLDGLVPGWSDVWLGAPVRSMGEGVGDFLACSFLADVDGSFHPEVVGDWDAIAYNPMGEPPALRRVDGSKVLSNLIGCGRSTALTATTLTDATARWTPGALAGAIMTANAQPAGGQRPQFYAIEDNTATTVTVSGAPLTAGAQAGDMYSGEEHADGEFWAAVLWDVYLALGGSSQAAEDRLTAVEKSLKLVMTAHKYLDDQDRESVTFVDGAEAILEADKFVWGAASDPGPNEAALKAVLRKRGFK